MNTLDLDTGSVLGIEQDRTQVRVAGVENLRTSEFVPPPLTVAIENAVAVDLDVFTTPFPKHEAVLEGMGKGVLLPIGRVVCELDFALEVDMNVVEEGQVERLANNKGFVLGQIESSAVVGLFETVEEVVGNVISVVLRGPDGDCLPAMAAALECIRMFLLELREGARDAGGELGGRECRDGGGHEGCEGEELHGGSREGN